MANDVVMPRLGWTMESGAVVEWLKRDGDPVSAGDLLFAVEADKGVTEVEALDDGILRIPGDSPLGVEVPVGTVLGFITLPGEEVPALAALAAAALASARSTETVKDVMTTLAGVRSNGRPRISPRARRRAAEMGIDWATIAGSGITGRIVERDVMAAAAMSANSANSANSALPRPRATPAVRMLAEERGVGLTSIAPTGPAGRITRADVRHAAQQETPPGAAIPMSPMRRIISQRMTESARTVAPVTLTTEADATELIGFRNTLKSDLAESGETVPLLTDLLVRLAALALLDHPDLNASLDGDAIVRHDAVHAGIAVDTERGLVVPVIRDAHRKSIHVIAAESAALIDDARRGAAAAADLSGGTFTVTNLGMFEIDAFTPIINLPEAAVLGVGRAVARPVVIDDETETIAIRKMMALSLTFDHRVVDGAPAAKFLQQVKRSIERPLVALTR